MNLKLRLKFDRRKFSLWDALAENFKVAKLKDESLVNGGDKGGVDGNDGKDSGSEYDSNIE